VTRDEPLAHGLDRRSIREIEANALRKLTHPSRSFRTIEAVRNRAEDLSRSGSAEFSDVASPARIRTRIARWLSTAATAARAASALAGQNLPIGAVSAGVECLFIRYSPWVAG
jgi:hypothetical protein